MNTDTMNDDPQQFAQVRETEQKAILAARGEAGDPDPAFFGMAFSGGGIRSATFNLGIVQALVAQGLIKRVDYLSVVSGGSYVGSWLSALILREGEAGLDKLVDHRHLDPVAAGLDPASRESAAIRFLRRYSNYLTPRYGLLSLDTLAAVANLGRNLILNLLVFLAVLVVLLLLPRMTVGLLGQLGAAFSPVLPALSGLLLLIAARGTGRGLAGLVAVGAAKPAFSPWTTPRVALGIVLPGALACLLLATWFAGQAGVAWQVPAGTAMGRGVVIYSVLFLLWALAGGALSRFDGSAGRMKEAAFHFVAAALAGAGGGLLAWGYGRIAGEYGARHPYWFGAGPGACTLLFLVSLVLTLHLGLAKRLFSEEAREWFGRVGGMALGLGIAWLVLVVLAGPVPALLDYGGTWLFYGGGLAWLATSIGGIALGRSSLTGAHAGKGGNPWAELLARVAPYVFVIGVLGVLSWGIGWSLDHIAGTGSRVVAAAPLSLSSWIDGHLTQADTVWHDHAPIVWVALATALALALGLAFRIDVNLFSMHQFYRNRLTRAYLGASRGEQRKPDPFTDFDPADDLPLAQLREQRPYLLVNAALNITDGKHMEWQERQASSFVFAPHYCGYSFPGGGADAYRPTDRYLGRERRWGPETGGVCLGSAMAVSGAAANPNAGYHSSPAMSFLLALFNVRLGRWCGNPNNKDAWRNTSPAFGLACLLKELFSTTGEKDRYLNLSDGGHFENLGLYELVRRRCRLIVICDAGQDKDFQFEDLGNAVRKCRVDLGARIDIDPRQMAAQTPGDRPRAVMGQIDYGDGNPGILVYLKPLLRQDEPVDVLHYAATHDEFPHQSTADQWFDESQFESYRQLGLRTGLEVFGRPAWHAPSGGGSAWIRAVIASLGPLCSNATSHTQQRSFP